jgi:recombination-promoting nuclease RpnE
MGNIHNPHDKIFRQSLSNIEVAKDFLLNHVPKDILAKFDLNDIKFCPNSYIDPQLTEQLSDIVYQAKMLDGNSGYLYFLAEHQSTALLFMPLRLLKYQISIIEHHLQQYPKATKLPIVFPVLFYHSEESPYPYSLNILDLFDDRVFAEQTFAKPAHLVDITKFSDDDIKKHNIIGLLEFIQKHIKDPDLSLIASDLIQIITDLCNHNKLNESLLLYIKCNIYYIMEIGNIEKSEEFVKQLKEVPIIGEKIMGTLARKFIEEGIAEGEAKGEAKGKAKGEKNKAKEIAMSMLLEGLDISLINKMTKLSIIEINELKSQIK